MLYSAVPLALLATEPWLVEDLHRTLFVSGAVLTLIQAIRGVLGLGRDGYSAFLMAVVSVFLMPASSLVLVLFGAPVIYSQVETLLCGFILSALILQPLITMYGLDGETWRQLVSFEVPFNSVYLGSVGGLVGAWFGVVPIALDWDRPWQAYPITIVLGAYLGSFVGSIIGSFFPAEPLKKVAQSKKKAKKAQK